MRTETFERGKVRIQEGVFLNFSGTVKDVDAERRKVTVSITLLGRAIVVELPVEHVQEIE